MIVRVGVPATGGGLWAAAADARAPVLVSAGALWDKHRARFRAPGVPVWIARDVALDSAGFVAMRHHGGYPWSVEQYVEMVVRGRGLAKRRQDCDDDVMGLDTPWTWWSAMDYCCEPEIAGDPGIVAERVDRTVASYLECFEVAESWRREGVTDLDDPMPILQGWRPDDYMRCAAELTLTIERANPCTCPDEECDAEWHRGHKGLPDLVGVGSVCRRELGGPEGLVAILRALDSALPAHVRFHLFGVKSAAVEVLRGHPRIASVDSMAWDAGARRSAKGAPNTVERRGEALADWYRGQRERVRAGQLRLLL